MSIPILLQTKFLIPRIGGSHVLRQHLVQRVTSDLDRKIVVISAPPGYGKTTLMVDAVNQMDCPVLWYQLDEGDNDPATLIAYLIEGLQQILPTFGSKTYQLLMSGDVIAPERMLVVLINELFEAPMQRWILVLDDYHVVTNPQVHQLTTTLLENHPHEMKILMASRTTPSLPLHRWRVRGLVSELRAEQLRFTKEEVQSWLISALPTLPDRIISQLTEKTEGWGAALQLALTLFVEHNDVEGLADKLGGSHPYIFNYLMEEVFEKQPAHIQQFLLHSSVLDQMNAGICEAVLQVADAQGILETLQHDNLFLMSLDDQRRWYRYHQLFREFLTDKLMQQSPFIKNQLHARLGQYYSQQHDYEAATRHFLQADLQADAAQALAIFAPIYLEQGRVDILKFYLNQFDNLADLAELLLIFGYVLRQQGKHSEALRRFEQAQIVGNAEQKTTALTQLAGIARSRGDYVEARRLAQLAVQHSENVPAHVRAFALMEQAKGEGFLAGMRLGYEIADKTITEIERAGADISPYQQAQLRLSLGQICWWYGDVRGAIQHCEAALRRLSDPESPLAAIISFTLAIPLLYRHEYQQALTYAEKALEICQQLDLQEHLPTAYAVLGNVLTRVGELSRGESCLRQAIEIADSLGVASYAQVMAAGYLALNLVSQGRIDEAQQVAETALFPHSGGTIVYEIYVCRSVWADTFLDNQQYQHATQIFEELIDIGEARQYRIPLAMAYFGLAYIHLKHGDEARCVQLARQSIDILEPTGAWELYVDQGQRALALCNFLQPHLPNNPFLQQVLKALNNKPSVIQVGSTPNRIRVQALGTLHVFRGAEEIQNWVSIKSRDLLAYFITFRHERIPLDRAQDAIWTDDEKRAATAFHTALYRLRNALRQGQGKHKFIIVETGDYRLDQSRFELDVEVFERQIQAAQHNQDVQLYESALKLYRGEYLDNFYYDWVFSERRRLAQLYLDTLNTLRGIYAQQQRYEDALLLAHRALEQDRLMEDVHCDVMKYMYHLGDRQGVIRHYVHLKQILQDELGVAPLSATDHCYQRVIRLFEDNTSR